MSVANSGSVLSGAAAKGAGSALTFTSVCSTHGVAVTVSSFTGTGSIVIQLQISMDNTNWFDLPGTIVATQNGTHYWTNAGKPMPALYVRANVVSISAGVTATLAGTAACE